MARVALIAWALAVLSMGCTTSSPSSASSGSNTKKAVPSGDPSGGGDVGRTGGQTGAGVIPFGAGGSDCSVVEALSKPGPKAKLEASRCIGKRSAPAILHGDWPYKLDDVCACRFSCESPDLLRSASNPYGACFSAFTSLSMWGALTESGWEDAGAFNDALLIDADNSISAIADNLYSGCSADRLGRCLLRPDEIHACDASHPETSCQAMCSLLEKRQNEAATQRHTVEIRQKPCGRSCRSVMRLDGHCYLQSKSGSEIDCALSFDAESLDAIEDCSVPGVIRSDHCAVCDVSETNVPGCTEGTGACLAYADSDGRIYRDCGYDEDAGLIKHYFEDGGAESCW